MAESSSRDVSPDVSGRTDRPLRATESHPRSPQHCPLCGFENLPESQFCENCGAGIAGSRKPSKERKVAPFASGQEQPKRTKQKRGKRRRERQPLQPWKLFSISFAAVVVAVVIYSLTNQGEDVHIHNGLPVAGTSVLQEIEQLQRIVETNPQDTQSLLRLANRLQDSRFLPRAIEYYKQYLSVVPGDGNARVDLGICYFESGDSYTAIVEMEKALEFEPLHQLGHLNLGVVNLAAGNLQKSNEWFAKCVEINPNTEAGKRAQRILEQHTSFQSPTVQ